MNDQLGITGSLENAAGFFKLHTELLIVIKLAIDNNVDCPIKTSQRLMAHLNVNDG